MAQETMSNGEMPKILRYIFGGAGLIIIAGGTAYFFGRIYLDAYYGWFGISEGVLFFSPYEYMYHSFPVLMMLIGVIAWIPVFYRLWKKGEYTLIDTTRPLRQQIGSVVAEGGNLVLSIIVILGFFIFNVKAVWGSMAYTGLIIGFFGMFLFRSLFIFFIWSWDTLKTREERAANVNIRMATFLVLLLVILPVLTGKLGEIGAISEFENRAQVTVVADNLPVELQPVQSGEVQSSNIKMLIVNNDIAYVFKSTVDDINTGSSRRVFNGKVYAIKLSDIKYLIYSKEPQQGTLK